MKYSEREVKVQCTESAISPPSGLTITHKTPLIAKFLIPAIKIAAGGRYAPSVRLRGHGVHVGGHSAEGSPAANSFAGDVDNCKPSGRGSRRVSV